MSLADEARHEELNALQSAMLAFTARLASRFRGTYDEAAKRRT